MTAEERKEYYKQYYRDNKEAFKQYRQDNKEAIAANNKEYRQDNKEHIEQYRKDNKEARVEYDKQYRQDNKKATSEYMKQYRQGNKKAIAEYKKQYEKNRMQTDINFRLLKSCRRRLNHAIKGNSKSASAKKLLGCTLEYLRQHLEKQFTERMTFENYGKWQIDHIIPCSSFNMENEEEQRQCFHYTNLQPLWAEDNLRKSNKIGEQNERV